MKSSYRNPGGKARIGWSKLAQVSGSFLLQSGGHLCDWAIGAGHYSLAAPGALELDRHVLDSEPIAEHMFKDVWMPAASLQLVPAIVTWALSATAPRHRLQMWRS